MKIKTVSHWGKLPLLLCLLSIQTHQLYAAKDLSSLIGASFTFSNTKTIASLIPVPITVSGQVTDDTGAPLPGATVMEKGTTNGTVNG